MTVSVYQNAVHQSVYVPAPPKTGNGTGGGGTGKTAIAAAAVKVVKAPPSHKAGKAQVTVTRANGQPFTGTFRLVVRRGAKVVKRPAFKMTAANSGVKTVKVTRLAKSSRPYTAIVKAGGKTSPSVKFRVRR